LGPEVQWHPEDLYHLGQHLFLKNQMKQMYLKILSLLTYQLSLKYQKNLKLQMYHVYLSLLKNH
jgi:hypothetical protein